jgi:SAM-dependent methyltransferase
MYTESTEFYDAIYGFKDYVEASRRLRVLLGEVHPDARCLLDVGCGTGRHLEHLRSAYQVEGLDVNPEFLKIAGQRCPDVPLHLANMADFSLDRTFDVITCLFSSIGYVRTFENLVSTVARFGEHLNPGGVVLIEPWVTPDQYNMGRLTANFVNEPDLKISWMYLAEMDGPASATTIHYMVGTPRGIRTFTERHVMGLFTHDQYHEAFRRAGLSVTHEAEGFFGRGLYVGTRSMEGGRDLQP